MLIDRDQVRKVAHLARLDLTETEEEQFTTQLSSILEYFQQLSELDTENVEPTARAIDVSNVTRVDQLQPYPDRELILENAPEREDSMQGEFFKVPQIMGGGE
ncbi:Asp-tRNA(Asn)/Glu-tRNA(Gln) amidotransferase subunit GatC [Leptolyngbya ohadii]|uniref:Asp-tRNA(Asn)/Glu-tRNA(Gln) amidotransferase subunit GatC n=1 Tax=Leptolyngbya ohadii TaxID=1962290 RepID=UPI0034E1C033